MKKIHMQVDAAKTLSHINPEIYGHFSEHLGRCIYNGIYVGEDSPIPNIGGVRKDIIEAFRKIKMPVLRWPGGCFADEYHWKDGIGEKQSRKKMVNTNWGGVTEDNSFGTHEFFSMCEAIGCAPYLAGNLGSGTVQELAEWIEYITFDGQSPLADLRRKNGREKAWKLKYLGIGNESWGCGGNMRPEYYADEYRRYQTFCKEFSGNQLFRIACGPNADDYNWTEVLLQQVKPWHAQGISLHYYTVPTGDWKEKGSSTVLTDAGYYETISKTLYMDELLNRHTEIMDRLDPERKISLIVDEWGCWYDVEPDTNPGFLYQQNTMRDAIVAACNLNLFNLHSDRVFMANLAQAVNVLQALVLTEGEKMVLTPTYHVFDLFRTHQDGELVSSSTDDIRAGEDGKIPMLSQSVSVKDGVMTLTLANCSLEDAADVDCAVNGFAYSSISAESLTSDNCRDHNTFDNPSRVTIQPFSAKLTESGFQAELPPCSVVRVSLQ